MGKGEAVKEKILKTAIKLFSKYGFEKTSFQLIAQKSKVSPTAPFYYFKTKEALIDAAIIQILQHNSDLQAESAHPEDNALDRLKKHFRTNLEWAKRYPDEAQIILLVYYMASFDKNWAEIYNRILIGARSKIHVCLLDGKRDNFFGFTMSPEILAEILHDALLGGIVNAVTVKEVNPESYQSLNEKWDLLIEHLVQSRSLASN